MMNCCGWPWIDERLDDSGMPLVTQPARPHGLDALEHRLARAAFPYRQASLSAWLHRRLTRFRMSRHQIATQDALSNTKLDLTQCDASQHTKAA